MDYSLHTSHPVVILVYKYNICLYIYIYHYHGLLITYQSFAKWSSHRFQCFNLDAFTNADTWKLWPSTQRKSQLHSSKCLEGFSVDARSLWLSFFPILLVIKASHSQPPGMVLKPDVNNGINYLSLNWLEGFLNHQQDDYIISTVIC